MLIIWDDEGETDQLGETPHTSLLRHRKEECMHAHVLFLNLGLSTQPSLSTSTLQWRSIYLTLQKQFTMIRMKFVLVSVLFLMSEIKTECKGMSSWDWIMSTLWVGLLKIPWWRQTAKRVRVQLCSSCVDYIGNQQPADGVPYPTLLFKKCKEIFYSSSPMLFLSY